jgi:Sec-independent protein translocase protein TatA
MTTTTKLHSLFGLGPAEVSIVLLAGVLVVGPSRLLRFARSAGRSVTGITITTSTSNDGGGVDSNEWMESIKSIPAEFNKGVEMGEIDARSRKARGMDNVDE